MNQYHRPSDDRMCKPVDDFPVAMAYVPWQVYSCTYDLDRALDSGTIFPELNKPFCPKGGMQRGR